MSLWPVDSFELCSPLPPAESEQALCDQTRLLGSFRPWNPNVSFRGWVSHGAFHLVVDFWTANLFMAVLLGRIEGDGDGSRVLVRARLDYVSAVMTAVVFALLGNQLLLAANGRSSLFHAGAIGVLEAVALMGLCWVLLLWGFSLRVRASREKVKKLLCA